MGRSKDPILSVRLPGDLDQRIERAAEKLDLSKNDIARHAIRAAVAAIEENGYRISLPLEMAVKKTEPVKSTPGGAFGAIARHGLPADSATGSTQSLNEEPAQPKPVGRVRKVMQAEALKHKPADGK